MERQKWTHKQSFPVDFYSWTHQYWPTSKGLFHHLCVDTSSCLGDKPRGMNGERRSRESEHDLMIYIFILETKSCSSLIEYPIKKALCHTCSLMKATSWKHTYIYNMYENKINKFKNTNLFMDLPILKYILLYIYKKENCLIHHLITTAWSA